MSFTRRCPGRDRSEFSDAPTAFIVDADASVRETLGLLVRSAGWQLCTAASAEEFLARPRVLTPSCLLTELRLPGLTGLELQRLIAERTEMPVIFMSEQIDVQSAIQAMKAGAIEVLIKPLAADVLLSAMRHAIERSRTAVNHLMQIRRLQERYAVLTAREREVMSLVVSGRLNKQVSGELGITEFTVKAHRGRMMRKMQARSFAELVTMVESLRRWTGAMAASIHLPSEPLTDTSSLAQSFRLRTSDLMFV
jgi:FixJ family two-component response regulator